MWENTSISLLPQLSGIPTEYICKRQGYRYQETVISAPQNGTLVGTVLLIACNEIKTFRVYIASYVLTLKINTSTSTVWMSATLR